MVTVVCIVSPPPVAVIVKVYVPGGVPPPPPPPANFTVMLVVDVLDPLAGRVTGSVFHGEAVGPFNTTGVMLGGDGERVTAPAKPLTLVIVTVILVEQPLQAFSGFGLTDIVK